MEHTHLLPHEQLLIKAARRRPAAAPTAVADQLDSLSSFEYVSPQALEVLIRDELVSDQSAALILAHPQSQVYENRISARLCVERRMKRSLAAIMEKCNTFPCDLCSYIGACYNTYYVEKCSNHVMCVLGRRLASEEWLGCVTFAYTQEVVSWLLQQVVNASPEGVVLSDYRLVEDPVSHLDCVNMLKESGLDYHTTHNQSTKQVYFGRRRVAV